MICRACAFWTMPATQRLSMQSDPSVCGTSSTGVELAWFQHTLHSLALLFHLRLLLHAQLAVICKCSVSNFGKVKQ